MCGFWGKGRRKDVNVGLAVELLRSGNACSVSDAARQLKVPASTLVDHAKRKGIDLTEYTPRKKQGGA